MQTPVAEVMALFSARTLRNGGDFSAPDYAEIELIDELASELETL